MKFITAVLTFVACIAVIAPAYSQDAAQFSVHAGIALPSGDFGDDSGNDAGAAKLGFMVGADYNRPIGMPGLGWVTSATLALNGIDADDVFGTDEVDTGFYFNVPILTGFRYTTNLSPTMQGYAQAQVGLNFFKGPSVEFNDDESTSSIGTSFGFGVGAGVVFNDRINVSIRYLSLGEPEAEYDGDLFEGDYEQPVSLLTLSIGLNL